MSATDPARVVVVIPALNEERAIRGVVVSAMAICEHVIVVDDGSTDATVERIADLPLTLIRHDKPLGKGQGLRDGFRKALELGFDAVIANLNFRGRNENSGCSVVYCRRISDQMRGSSISPGATPAH